MSGNGAAGGSGSRLVPDPSLVERLRSLGFVDATGSRPRTPEEPGFDPTAPLNHKQPISNVEVLRHFQAIERALPPEQRLGQFWPLDATSAELSQLLNMTRPIFKSGNYLRGNNATKFLQLVVQHSAEEVEQRSKVAEHLKAMNAGQLKDSKNSKAKKLKKEYKAKLKAGDAADRKEYEDALAAIMAATIAQVADTKPATWSMRESDYRVPSAHAFFKEEVNMLHQVYHAQEEWVLKHTFGSAVVVFPEWQGDCRFAFVPAPASGGQPRKMQPPAYHALWLRLSHELWQQGETALNQWAEAFNRAHPDGQLDSRSFARLLHDRCFLSLVFRRYICLKFAYDQNVDESLRVDHVQAMCNMLRMCLVLRRKLRKAGQLNAGYLVTHSDCDTSCMLKRAATILHEESFKVKFREAAKLARAKRAPEAGGILKSKEKAAAPCQAQEDDEAKEQK
jgi:hypothetical protein